MKDVWSKKSPKAREHQKEAVRKARASMTKAEKQNQLEKAKATCRIKYGHDFYQGSDSWKRKFPEQIRKACKRYTVENETFDSSWELALWIYAKDHNEEIEREPQAFIYEFNGEKHRYYPDFKYKGQFVEIKGNHLLSETNEPESRLRELAKLEFAKQNNILFLFQKDVLQYREYAAQKFGSWIWHRQFYYRKNEAS